MNTTPELPGNPSFPRVVGFDMPSQPANGEPSDISNSVVALLDAVPRKEWLAIFMGDSASFKGAAGISDIRVIGRNMTFLGPAEKLRALPPKIHAFVYRVSRRCLQERTLRLTEAPLAHAPSPKPDLSLARDLAAIARIKGIPTILEAVVNATGMRFAAVARVTDDRWTACAVYDLIEFGLQPGQDLVLESTICNEIRQHHELVMMDQASEHPVFATHPTPAMYGFESYISVPIMRADGSFFGTLCALDPEPAKLDDVAVETLKMFAQMIGLQLDAVSLTT